MRFIEISDGKSIDIDQIEVVERKDDFTTSLYTHHNVYEANFPYMTLLQLLEAEKATEEKPQEINRFEQFWAG